MTDSAARRARPARLPYAAALLSALVLPAIAAAQDSTTAPPPAPAAAAASPTAASPATATPAATDSTPSAESPLSYRVKRGDTLWDLARQYLEDPFRWPEIYRLNTDVVRDPHWIYPGQSLVVPGGAQVVATDELAPRARLEQLPTPDEPPGRTVFAEALAPVEASAAGRPVASSYPHTAVRQGEFYAAPWVDRQGGPAGTGRIVASPDIPGIVEFSTTRHLGPEQNAYVTLPKGAIPARGDRFVAFERGPEVPDRGQVMIPTGIVEVVRPSEGDATLVRVVTEFGDLAIGQAIMPLPSFTQSPDVRPVRFHLGPESRVVYVPSDALLATLQQFIVLDASRNDGVHVGDEFTLYRPRVAVRMPRVGGQATLPEETIAIAQVVRVTDRGTTAVVIHQDEPAIREGAHARLTARMP